MLQIRAASSSRVRSAVCSASSNASSDVAAIEPVIGHLKTDGHLGRCYLKGRDGDAASAILSAVGHNLRLVLAWLRMILRYFFVALFWSLTMPGGLKSAS
jgi:IS5 family transposase